MPRLGRRPRVGLPRKPRATGEELDVFAAFDALQRPGATACSECGADVALGPLA